MTEIWKDIPGYEGLYQVSNLGQVRTLNYRKSRKPKILLCEVDPKGYKRIQLSKGGKGTHYLIHRLVAICFIENPENLPIINHKDEDPSNNRIDNLEWCSIQYNNNYNRKYINTKSKKVNCFDLQGNLVKTYNSMNEAETQDGFTHGAIAKVCRGERKTHHGYRFEYA